MLLFEILTAAWFFALGAVIGSFLNVVVWRTPRGESIIGPSRCPQCGTPIRWYNNVPIFGWLWLGGKCRDCKLPISPRYPLVEFLCGAMFLAVALAELPPRGFADVILDANWTFAAVYAADVLLLCALLAWALMQVDEQEIPWRQVFALWIVGIVIALFVPRDTPASPLAGLGQLAADGLARKLLEASLGFVAGGLGGAIVALVSDWTGGARRVLIASAVFAAIGLFLGVEAAAQIALVACALRLASLLISWPVAALCGVPLTMDIFVATAMFLCWHHTAIWAAAASRLYLR